MPLFGPTSYPRTRNIWPLLLNNGSSNQKQKKWTTMTKDNHHKYRIFFGWMFTHDRILSKIHVTGFFHHITSWRGNTTLLKKKEKKSNLLPIYVKFKSQAWNFNTDFTSLRFKKWQTTASLSLVYLLNAKIIFFSFPKQSLFSWEKVISSAFLIIA